MNNLAVLCFIGGVISLVIFFMIVRFLLRRLFGGQSTPASGSQSGPLNPTYDDPKIQGRGSFGRNLNSLPGRRSSSSKTGGGQSGRIDSDSVQGRGSFGRDKKD